MTPIGSVPVVGAGGVTVGAAVDAGRPAGLELRSVDVIPADVGVAV